MLIGPILTSSSMAQGCNLPQELVEAIIDFLYDDRSALQCCSLVARSWRTRSYFHFFHTFQVIEPQITTKFVNLLDGNPMISAGIRELELVLPYAESDGPIPPRIFIDILQRLPSLRRLALWGIHIGPYLPGERFTFDYPRLHTLELSSFVGPAEQAVRTMALFSRVRVDNLRIADSEYFNVAGLDFSILERLFPHPWEVGSFFSGLNIDATDGFLYDLLPRIICPEVLHSVDAPQLDLSRTRDNFAAFLKAIGSGLRHMRWEATNLYLRVPDSEHSGRIYAS